MSINDGGPPWPVLTQGPIPRFLHGLIEYFAGVLFIGAPIAFSFESGAATAISIVVGVVVLVVAATTDGPTGLSSPCRCPPTSPWTTCWPCSSWPCRSWPASPARRPRRWLFIVMGVAHLLITIGTRFRHAPERQREHRRA